MIIIEGPDACGKSTLINYLLDNFGDELQSADSSHLSSDERNSEDYRSPHNVRARTYTALAEAIVGVGPPKVWDRLFFSELVYGEVLRGGSCFSWREEQHILRTLTAISPPVVFCLPSLATYLDRLPQEKQVEGVLEHSIAIYEKYKTLCAVRHPRVIVYNYERGPAAPKSIRHMISGYLIRRNKRTWSPTYSLTLTLNSPSDTPSTETSS